MVNAAVYVRISADKEGKALGVKRQEEDARALAERLGWDVVAVFRDNDVSAVKKRPGWDDLLAAIIAGEVDAVAAYSSSRLYRDVDAEKGRLFAACLERNGDGEHVQIETVASGTIDPYTADGRMLANILASIDAAERERTSERVKRQQRAKRERAEFLGGYRPFGFAVKDKRLVPVDAEARLIREAASDVLSGVSLASIARRWNAAGVKTSRGFKWYKERVGEVLKADRNAPAILTPTDLAAVQAVFDGRRTGRNGTPYLLTGLLTCGKCGASMGGRGGKYVCRATGKVHLATGADRLDAYVLAAALKREESDAPKRVEVHDPGEELVQRREKLVAEQESLGDSDLSVAAIRGRDRKLQREIDAIDDELEDTRPVGHFEGLLREAEEHDPDAWQDHGRRAWLDTLVDRVVLAPTDRGSRAPIGDRVDVTWR
ncbi:MAG TPA: recombinase family protein [Actinomycetota bacterium]|jgi:DNA invertase Pin-like site-specific DNA recombinase